MSLVTTVMSTIVTAKRVLKQLINRMEDENDETTEEDDTDDDDDQRRHPDGDDEWDGNDTYNENSVDGCGDDGGG